MNLTKKETTMKRIAAFTLCVCLLLCGCGPTYEVPYAPTTQGTTVPATQETTQETTVATEPVILYQHPLTGEALESPYMQRPTAVVINNIKACMPQSGLSEADMIFEFETEGGITRLLAIFSDLSDTAAIGPVRSARTYFSSVANGYGLPLIHCGGSRDALKGMHDKSGTLKQWDHIDQRFNGGYFYRDQARKSAGYAYEHTLFTTGEMLTEGLADKKLNTVYTEPVDYGMVFAEDAAVTGEAAGTVTVTFRGKKTTTLTYDAATGLYSAAQYNKNHIDAVTGETLTYRNVLMLHTKQQLIYDGTYSRSYYDLYKDDGEGYYAIGGQIVPIKWSRKDANSPFVFTNTDGTPLTLGVGTTYVGVIGSGGAGAVTYN